MLAGVLSQILLLDTGETQGCLPSIRYGASGEGSTECSHQARSQQARVAGHSAVGCSLPQLWGEDSISSAVMQT